MFVATTSEIYTIHPEHMNKGLHEGHGLYKSEDGGVNWTRSDVGIIEAKPAQIAAHPLFPFNIWVGGESGRGNLFTPDGGDTWLFSPSITSHYPMVYAFNYVLPTIIYATGSLLILLLIAELYFFITFFEMLKLLLINKNSLGMPIISASIISASK